MIILAKVLDDLGLALPDEQTPFVSKSAAAQARQRPGSDPLKWLFDHSARHWCSQDRRAYVSKGLVLFAMDGTTLRTHDNAETREHFGAQNYSSGAVASDPQVANIEAVAMDINTAFDLEAKQQCPGARVVYDLFHVVAKYGREVIDRVRVDEANRLRDDRPQRKVVKRARWLLLRNPENVPATQQASLENCWPPTRP